jgi:predicted peptidase
MPRTTSIRAMLSTYNDSLAQIEQLKKDVYIWAMHGQLEKVAELKKAIIAYETDIRLFESQMIEYKAIGEK